MPHASPGTTHVTVAVALTACPDYSAPRLAHRVGECLEQAGLAGSGTSRTAPAAGFPTLRGARILVKPNLVMARPLACTHPALVATACAWLMDQGAHVVVADSPGFGSARGVARAIGLMEALRPLGLAVREMDSPVPVRLPLDNVKNAPRFPVSRLALECDGILSLPRVKAHSQMRLTLAVKNCFGCVNGLRKAFIHAREGRRPPLFADCLAALWAALPPVAALADGIMTMHVTGPGKGEPYALGLVGASVSALALDASLCEVLRTELAATPLGEALLRRVGTLPVRHHPLAAPGDFPGADFVVPERLTHTSFHPIRLIKSCCKRLWAGRQH